MDKNLEKDLEKGEDLTRVGSKSAPPPMSPDVDPRAEHVRMPEPPVNGGRNVGPTYLESFKGFIKKAIQSPDGKSVPEDAKADQGPLRGEDGPRAVRKLEESLKAFWKYIEKDIDAKGGLEDLETDEKSPHPTVSPCAALEWENAIRAFNKQAENRIADSRKVLNAQLDTLLTFVSDIIAYN